MATCIQWITIFVDTAIGNVIASLLNAKELLKMIFFYPVKISSLSLGENVKQNISISSTNKYLLTSYFPE